MKTGTVLFSGLLGFFSLAAAAPAPMPTPVCSYSLARLSLLLLERTVREN